MPHDRVADIIEHLERQYQEDLAKTRALYSTPWQKSTNLEAFEKQRVARDRWGKVALAAVVAWLVSCLGAGGLARAVDSLFGALR